MWLGDFDHIMLNIIKRHRLRKRSYHTLSTKSASSEIRIYFIKVQRILANRKSYTSYLCFSLRILCFASTSSKAFCNTSCRGTFS